MTREEAMTLITQRLAHIHTGSAGAGVEALIYIVQTVAKAEREACAMVCEEVIDRSVTDCAAAIRARGEV